MTATTTQVTTARPVAGIPVHGLHHFAWRCRDAEQTRHFYEDLLGFPLVHTEVQKVPGTDSFFRHLFFDTGDGKCIAFFELHNVGEQDGWRADVSTGNGLPVWVNHVAFAADDSTVPHHDIAEELPTWPSRFGLAQYHGCCDGLHRFSCGPGVRKPVEHTEAAPRRSPCHAMSDRIPYSGYTITGLNDDHD